MFIAVRERGVQGVRRPGACCGSSWGRNLRETIMPCHVIVVLRLLTNEILHER